MLLANILPNTLVHFFHGMIFRFASLKNRVVNFRTDLDAARTEFASLGTDSKSKPAGCEAEAQLMAKDPY
jgi:hypothetical protein